MREMLHPKPQGLRQAYPSLWTLELAAQAGPEEGLTKRRVAGRDHPGHLGEGVGGALAAVPKGGSPVPTRVPKRKRRRDRLMSFGERPEDWALGFEDEVWWSRLALPMLHAWSIDREPMRLVRQSVAKEDPDPKAISCYGLYLPELEQTWLRFVDGRPVAA